MSAAFILLLMAGADERFPAAKASEVRALFARKDGPVPAWARVLARALPKTTATMLDLDALHRAKNPLGAMAAQLRWEAADEAGCAYAKAYAEADLKTAGASRLSDRALTAFARKMTRAAHAVTDAEVAALIEAHGPAKVVAMVHTLAHVNFQIRLFAAMGIAVEADGPYPPAVWGVDRDKLPTAGRPAWAEVLKAGGPASEKPGWREVPYADLRRLLEEQKVRKSRVAPLDDAKLAHLSPPERAQAARIVWSNVSLGYQPALTRAWFDTMRTYQTEAKLDRTFTGSLFWVITRTNECFY